MKLFTIYHDKFSATFQFAIHARTKDDAVARYHQYHQRVHGYGAKDADLLVVPMGRTNDVLYLNSRRHTATTTEV